MTINCPIFFIEKNSEDSFGSPEAVTKTEEEVQGWDFHGDFTHQRWDFDGIFCFKRSICKWMEVGGFHY